MGASGRTQIFAPEHLKLGKTEGMDSVDYAADTDQSFGLE